MFGLCLGNIAYDGAKSRGVFSQGGRMKHSLLLEAVPLFFEECA